MKITNELCDKFTQNIVANIEAVKNPNRHDLTERQKAAISTAAVVSIQTILGLSIEQEYEKNEKTVITGFGDEKEVLPSELDDINYEISSRFSAVASSLETALRGAHRNNITMVKLGLIDHLYRMIEEIETLNKYKRSES